MRARRLASTGWPKSAGTSRRQDGLSGEEEIDRRVLLGRHRRAALRGGGARRAVVVADQLLLHPRQRALQPPQPRVRPAAGSTRERGRPDGGDRRRPRRRAGEPELRPRPRGRHVPRREGDRDDARRRGPVPNCGLDGGRARRHHAADPRRVDGGEGGRRGRGVRRLAARRPPAPRARGLPSRSRAVRAQVRPRAEGDDLAGRARAAGRRHVRRGPHRDGAPGARAVADLGRRRADAGRCRRPDPPRARRDRAGPPEGQRAARLLPRGASAHRGLHPRARPHRPGGRAAPDHLDAAVPAGLRRRDAHPARAAGQGPRQLLRDHAAARRLDR